jgi:hypothetical protein
MAIKQSVDFAISCTGELTGQSYVGTFTAKTKLSVKEQFREDELYRTLLGVDSQHASVAAKTLATALAYLGVRIIKSPDWWTKYDNGMEIEDMNLIVAVHNACTKEIDKEYKALSDEANKAEEALRLMSLNNKQ